MSGIVTLFQLAAPAMTLLALAVGMVWCVALLLGRFGVRMLRRPRVVTMARHRQLVRRIETRRR